MPSVLERLPKKSEPETWIAWHWCREPIYFISPVSLSTWETGRRSPCSFRTGRRLWRLVPEFEGDFNVPTPVAVQGRLLVTTENNGTRLYRFHDDGIIDPTPVARNEDLAHDTSSPVVLDGLALGVNGRLLGLDLEAGLRTLWEVDEDAFADYCSLVAGNGHVLAVAQSGWAHLVRASRSGGRVVGRVNLFGDDPATDRDVWAHPALAENRLYVRNMLGVSCFLLQAWPSREEREP